MTDFPAMPMTPASFVAATGPLIGASGSAFYFADETVAVGQELGLDALHFYYLGRGGVLGDAPAAVVQCAFGSYFSMELVGRIWNEARAIATPTVAAQRYFECSAELGRRLFRGLELAATRSALEAIVAAGPTGGLPLFRGIAALPAAADDPGRTMQLLTVVRELRGDAHLVALVSLGIDGRAAHYVRRPEYFEAFGWSAGATPKLRGDEDRRLALAEDLTDTIVTPSFSAVPPDARAPLVAMLEALHGRLRAAGRGMPVEPGPGRD
jgi:hypothetical protein